MKELEFIKEIDLLKNIERQTSPFFGGRKENSAEHSWHLATAVFVLKDLASEKLNLEKALSLALFHDIVEIDGGDTFVYSDLTKKSNEEEACLKRLTSLLPSITAEEIQSLWHEYENRTSYESKFVNAIDRFLPMYANYLTKGYSWKKHGIKKDQVIERNKQKIIDGLPSLWNEAEKIIADGLEKNYLLP